MPSSDPPLLAGDLGATKTDLALFVRDQTETKSLARSPLDPPAVLRRASFLNADFADFDTLLAVFLQGEQPAAACFGVAGPIRDGCVRMTNLNWRLVERDLQKSHKIGEVRLINDLVAMALGAVALSEDDLHILHAGVREVGAPVSILAPGSGLGEAFLLRASEGWQPCPSEGGHAAFAPVTEEQIELLRFMWRLYATDAAHPPLISMEQVCSGLALPTLLAFTAGSKPLSEGLRVELLESTHKNPLILRAAQEALENGRQEDAALAAVRLMVDILALEAAALTLKTMSRGGLFLGGGMGRRLLPFLEEERFMGIFARGAHQHWLSEVPISVITTPHCALLGAAIHCAQQTLSHEK